MNRVLAVKKGAKEMEQVMLGPLFGLATALMVLVYVIERARLICFAMCRLERLQRYILAFIFCIPSPPSLCMIVFNLGPSVLNFPVQFDSS